MEKDHIKTIAIVGAGLMGTSIAQVFAGADIKTILHDKEVSIDPLERISENISIMIGKGVLSDADRKRITGNISFCSSLKEAVSCADMVIECIFENMEQKQNLFCEIEKYCQKHCIMATNTSVMSPTQISAKLKNKSCFIGMHFWNPAHLIPLVELVLTENTHDYIARVCYDLLESAGKKPVICKKDIPGFIANRLQHALWREAISLVQKGIADPKTVDDAVKYGPGLRWPQLGPIENADMIGLDLTLNIHNYVLKYLEDSHKPSLILKEKVQAGELGFKTNGKGFYNFTQQEIDNSNRQLREYLIDNIKKK